ncbi:tetratricopeptide repeat protein [Gillisia sp. Hel_I_29]|uniref:tetratricopeptide repeat protein n=1 Tax=Gillisia sp. Hel_I_29 TaxID=1249975 RepID=UPI00054DFD28|nr:tetratricopeptide repeat protein [Gillisia sp. Hel_I_29]
MEIFIIITIGLITFYLFKRNKKKDSTEKEKDLSNVKSESTGNSIQFTIELNEKEFVRRAKNGKLDKKRKTTRDIAGFYGTEKKSPNKNFSIYSRDGLFRGSKWENGKIALVKNNKLLFKKEIERPHDCIVSNDGIVICCDWSNAESLTGIFYVFDKSGIELFSIRTNANLGNCALSIDSKIAIFETHNSDDNDGDKLFIIDLQDQKILKKLERPISFKEAIIKTKDQKIILTTRNDFIYEIDFNGLHTNKEQYESQILNKGSITDVLYHFESKPDEVKFNDNDYLDVLSKAVNDENASYSYGLDKLYRRIGEFYENKGEINQTIHYWEKAIQINPKVGVKRKLQSYKVKGK